jgi:acetolactate synthase-1/2/3 large subunit
MQNEVPMVVMSGESQTLGEDPALDIEAQWYGGLTVGGIERFVEPVAKWARAVTSPHTLYESVIRAGEMAQRLPKGPIYLNVALEHMLHDWTPPAAAREVPPAPIVRPRQEDVAKVAELVRNSKSPVGSTPTQIFRPITRSISAWADTRRSTTPISSCSWALARPGIRHGGGRPAARSSRSTTTRSRTT